VFASVIHELCCTCSWITINEDPTDWLKGASPPNACILSSVRWMTPVHCMTYPALEDLTGGNCVQCVGDIHSKEGRMLVLTRLALSCQTVGSLLRVIHEQAKRHSWMIEANMAPLGLASIFLSPGKRPTKHKSCKWNLLTLKWGVTLLLLENWQSYIGNE